MIIKSVGSSFMETVNEDKRKDLSELCEVGSVPVKRHGDFGEEPRKQ